ncbi:MAG: S41 family peptidase [Acidobacteriota bacterium]
MHLNEEEFARSTSRPRTRGHRKLASLGSAAAALLLTVSVGLPVVPAAAESADGGAAAPLVEELIDLIRENYILDQRIPNIEQTLREQLAGNAYEGLEAALAFSLTRDLREASSDLHFGVQVRPPARASHEAATPPAGAQGGLRRVEVLAGNVGYLEIAAFVDPAQGAEAVDAAFAELAGTDALLIDVRTSRGGHPAMVAYLASYLFTGEPFVLSRIYWRNRDETMEFRTRTDLPSPRYPDRPVFVLTSADTPSAAEGFSYHLKHFGRATLVGETTAGAAHPIQIFPLGENFRVAIPTARAINPRTGTNWEGKGVEPDEDVPAHQALNTAHRCAVEALLEQASEPNETDTLRRILTGLE